MTNEEIIAEFFKDLEKDMMTKLFEERAEQAARNLIARTEQQTASAIFFDIHKAISEVEELEAEGQLASENVLREYNKRLTGIKKKHLSEAIK